MAKCAFCGREMLKAKGCRKITIRFVDGSRADPIKVGAPGDFYFGCEEMNDPDFRCGDCGAMVGGYHHPGCDCERCSFPAIVRPIKPFFERRESVEALSFFYFQYMKGDQHYE